jgi:hypothetical protein
MAVQYFSPPLIEEMTPDLEGTVWYVFLTALIMNDNGFLDSSRVLLLLGFSVTFAVALCVSEHGLEHRLYETQHRLYETHKLMH